MYLVPVNDKIKPGEYGWHSVHLSVEELLKGERLMYSRQQEDRAERKLTKVGFVLDEDTGRRTSGKGDKLMTHEDTGLSICIDHKSTRGKEGIRIERKQLEKIRLEAKKLDRLGAITFSMLGSRKVYIIFDIDDLEGVMY